MFIGGKNVVKEVLNNNQKIIKAYIWDKFDDKDIINELSKREISIKYVQKFELDKIDNMNHQGIILDVPDFQYSSLKEILSNNNPFITHALISLLHAHIGYTYTHQNYASHCV